MYRKLCVSLVVCAALAACRGAKRAEPPPASAAQVAGSIAVEGIRSPVSIVRDRWGVPHITAANQDDLFFAQGFVQAQDRLFQMDLWRRSVQGRLSEVLGSNFIERDIMTRRIQYAADADADWASYGPDVKAIAAAFVRGINAWVAIAREHPSEEFVLAGWSPEPWTADDLRNRTDAFIASGDAIVEVLRARAAAAGGWRDAFRWLPAPAGAAVPRGFDSDAIDLGVADALRRIGTRPFFMSIHEPSGSNAWIAGGRRSSTGRPIVANDPHRPFENPSLRYVVHLRAPGWNVIGAAAPWRPGVALGHNDQLAWAMTAVDADVQDLFVEKVNRANAHQVDEDGRWADTRRTPDAVAVKGRAKPFAFEHERTRRGTIIAVDRERHLAFSVRWTGDEPGTAPELAAVGLDRARSWTEFRAALERWKLPAVDVLYADVDGHIGRQQAALVPIRRGWNGALPASSSSSDVAWSGWKKMSDLPHAFNPPAGYAIAANDDPARIARLEELMASEAHASVAAFKAWQHDVVSKRAARLIALVANLHADRADVEAARAQLVAWNQRLDAESPTAALYELWERAVVRIVSERALGVTLTQAIVSSGCDLFEAVVPRIRSRPDVLLEALTSAVDQWRGRRQPTWGSLHYAMFAHPLDASAAARKRFDVGPFPVGGGAATVMAAYGRQLNAEGGAAFRQILDVGDWDRSVFINAPGQSGSPASAHFSDLATIWAAGEYVPLAFSDVAIAASAEAKLMLVPK